MIVLIISLAEFNSNRSYKHLKVAHARNFRHFEFFYGAILFPFKNCPMIVLISLLNFNSNRSYKHLKVAHAHNFRHFEFFMVLSYCPLKTVQ